MISKKHKATYAGKTHNQTKTKWIQTLDTNGAALDRLLAIHGDMQTVIDKAYSSRQAQQISINAFLSRPLHTNQ